MNNSKVQTLSDLIRYGKTSSFALPLVSTYTRNGDLVHLDELAYAKYDDMLMRFSEVVTLTTEEYNKFRFNPQLLSVLLYRTPNLDHLILYLNRCSEFEFDFKRVRLLPYSAVIDLFKHILSHEEGNIKKSQLDATRG